jgi:5'(3')-deoxyribonucleotidase
MKNILKENEIILNVNTENEYIDISQMNKKPSVLIDLDDVLNNLLSNWISLYNQKYNDNLSEDSILDWDITKYVKPECGILIFDLLKTPGLLSKTVQPKTDSIKVTQMLSKYYELYIVTACTYPENIIEKFKWVSTHFPHIDTENIITAKNKGLIVGDYIIDDYENNLIASKCMKKLLFYHPHNSCKEIPDDIIRVSDWNEILWFFAAENDELKNDAIEYTAEKTFYEEELSDMKEEETSFFSEQYTKVKNIIEKYI